jgi:hypothetical protein
MANANELRKKVVKIGVDARNRASREMLTRLQDRARQHRVTGKMLAQTRVENFDRGTAFGFIAKQDVDYAEFVDEGTHPHTIVPKRRGGVLVFYWPRVGRVVYLKRVSHPGNPPFQQFSGPVSEFREIMVEAFIQAVARNP